MNGNSSLVTEQAMLEKVSKIAAGLAASNKERDEALAEVERLKAERVKTLAAIDHIFEITIKEHREINSIIAGVVRFSEAVERLKAEIRDRPRPTKPA